VHLIVAGALDEQTEAKLARTLGVSARHLRRLFSEHVGATPDQLARSCRAHFARRLLDDSDLSITEVAFASGFGSARQLGRACHEIFAAAPRDLRARRRRGDRLAADGGLPLRLAFTGPLEWEAMLAYFRARAIPGVECVADGAYRRTVVIDGDPGVLELRRGGPDHLLLTAHLPYWEGLIHVVHRARQIFALDVPAEDALAHLRFDPVVGELIRARPGLRPPGTWDPFETGVRAIIGQQISVAGANTIIGRLVEQFGKPVPGLEPLGLSRTFPPAHLLAEQDVTAIGVPRARAAAIQAWAQAVAGGEVRLDRSVTLDQLADAITAIRGLGPWTAHYIALRLGERDAFPADDLGLRRALGRLHRDRAAAWSPWRATAAIQLWSAQPTRLHKIDIPRAATFTRP
jgi:AraC family transcriptional regulator of adaptative response / DNA-3-methyladenine glycosylase II